MLNRSITTTLAALAIAGASVTAAYASEEALLDALVKKGVLKQADAQKIKAESAHSGSAGNSKIKLNESVKELSIYGDLRLRWQHSQGTLQLPVPDNSFQNQSARFRLLIGGNFKLTDGVTAGVELATQSAANQRYTTLGNGGNDYALGISKAFIGWNPSKEFSVTAGRQSMPFYSTEMVWDNDVRLDGVTEKIDLGALLGLGDGLHLHFISGQFVGGDNLSFNAASENNRDGWLFQSQLKAVADLGGAKLTFAPGFQWSSSSASAGLLPDVNGLGNLSSITSNLSDADKTALLTQLGVDLTGLTTAAERSAALNTALGTGATGYLNELRVLLAPGDISFDLAGTKAKFLWDFAYNFGAGTTGSNARLTAPISATQDRMAWLLGIQVGENKNKGDFSVFGNYREIGAGALNTFYSDSDFALGLAGNQRGFKVGAKYSLTRSATLTAAYTASSNIDATQQRALQTLSGLNSSQMVTIDLGLKF
jgi:hypothetical protein